MTTGISFLWNVKERWTKAAMACWTNSPLPMRATGSCLSPMMPIVSRPIRMHFIIRTTRRLPVSSPMMKMGT